MFWGEHQNSLDEKGRVTIPAPWRPRLADGFFLCAGLESCLFLLPMERWTHIQQKLAEAPLGNPDAERLQRHFGGGSEMTLDRQGRVLIPPKLRGKAGLSGDVLLCGAFSRIEIWNPETRQQYDEGNLTDERLREAFKALVIRL